MLDDVREQLGNLPFVIVAGLVVAMVQLAAGTRDPQRVLAIALVVALLVPIAMTLVLRKGLRVRSPFFFRPLRSTPVAATKFSASEASFAVQPYISGIGVYLDVTNHGPTADFSAQIISLTGVREGVALPMSIKWRNFASEARSIRRGQTHLLHLADGDGHGDRTAGHWDPAVWVLHGVEEHVKTHAMVSRSEEIYTKDIEAVVRLTRHDTDEALMRTVQLGFDNQQDKEIRNLKVRARIVEASNP